MATLDIFGTSRTENPEYVVAEYIRQIEVSIRDLENDLLVTQKQLVAAKAALKALEEI